MFSLLTGQCHVICLSQRPLEIAFACSRAGWVILLCFNEHHICFCALQGYAWKVDVSLDDNEIYGNASVTGTSTFAFNVNGQMNTTGLTLANTESYDKYGLSLRIYTEPAFFENTIRTHSFRVSHLTKMYLQMYVRGWESFINKN